MRKLILSAVLFMSMGTMAFAQQADQKRERKTAEQKAQQLTDVLDKKLALTADQKSKIYEISLDGIKARKENRVKAEHADKSVMKAEFEKRDLQINTVLNEQQRKLFQEWKAEKMNSMKQGKKDGKGTHKKKSDKI